MNDQTKPRLTDIGFHVRAGIGGGNCRSYIFVLAWRLPKILKNLEILDKYPSGRYSKIQDILILENIYSPCQSRKIGR